MPVSRAVAVASLAALSARLLGAAQGQITLIAEAPVVIAATGEADPGVAALTAGPGVTNGMSAIAGAFYNRSPITILGGRAPEMRWGSGSLQEIDHVPLVEPLVKAAGTVKETADIAARTAEAIDALKRAIALQPGYGPSGGPEDRDTGRRTIAGAVPAARHQGSDCRLISCEHQRFCQGDGDRNRARQR